HLLEAGFGSGTTAVLLADLGYQVDAIDREPGLVARFQQRYSDWERSGRVNASCADMLRLPWEEGAFDAVYHQGVLEHCSDDVIVQALTEQGRVARRIVFDVPNHRYDAHPFGNERLLGLRHWRSLIARAGLEIEELFGREFPAWFYAAPFAAFSRSGLLRAPWFGRNFGRSWIFLCRPVASGEPQPPENRG
ncbi:MAG: class I SAM-dependent methyltransferase, partial [Bryobacteraceae bacterium]